MSLSIFCPGLLLCSTIAAASPTRLFRRGVFGFETPFPRVRLVLITRRNSRSRECVTTACPQCNDEGEQNWILDNGGVVRSAPLSLGIAGLAAVLLNRSFSGIAAVADASSSQSRADVLAVSLSATVVLAGLVWKSIYPKPPFPVALDGVECLRILPYLPPEAARELIWAWEALAGATHAVALVIVYGTNCVLQAGFAAESSEKGVAISVDAGDLLSGSLCTTVRISGKQMYMANLALYPGRFQLPFLPKKTQAVIIQPLGKDGIMIMGGDVARGFGQNDQAWMVAIGEKLDSTLAELDNIGDLGYQVISAAEMSEVGRGSK